MDGVFYRNGLRFSCQRCSQCCRIEPGFVFLCEEDLHALVEETGVPQDQFLKQYCRWVSMRGYTYLSLKEKPNYDCIFWNEGGCEVYSHRPLQCRSYPFWESNLSSREQWEALTSTCAGIGQGSLHTYKEIQTWVELRRQSPVIRIPNGKGVDDEG